MKFTVLTLFPDIVKVFFENSIMAKAVEKEIIAYDLVNIRDFALDKHHTCDDGTYGGGAGQLMMPDPQCECPQKECNIRYSKRKAIDTESC